MFHNLIVGDRDTSIFEVGLQDRFQSAVNTEYHIDFLADCQTGKVLVPPPLSFSFHLSLYKQPNVS